MNINKLLVISIIYCITACNNIDKNYLKINLDNATDSIYYSEFAKSLDYIQLNMNDSCLISEIKSIKNYKTTSKKERYFNCQHFNVRMC